MCSKEAKYNKEFGYHAKLDEEKMFKDIEEIKECLEKRLETLNREKRSKDFLRKHPKV